jgi:hypothetical protein
MSIEDGYMSELEDRVYLLQDEVWKLRSWGEEMQKNWYEEQNRYLGLLKKKGEENDS